MHTYGWPLQKSLNDKVYGGAFLYHMAPNKVLCGFVVGLDYENPYLSPYQTFQTWKHHPEVTAVLAGQHSVLCCLSDIQTSRRGRMRLVRSSRAE